MSVQHMMIEIICARNRRRETDESHFDGTGDTDSSDDSDGIISVSSDNEDSLEIISVSSDTSTECELMATDAPT
eukprot:6238407-Karenia_brevis.AAC.1